MTLFSKALAASERLSALQLKQALRFWGNGKDTFDIAGCLAVPEHVVFNSLREAREKIRLAK
jgi:hypothetical protein